MAKTLKICTRNWQAIIYWVLEESDRENDQSGQTICSLSSLKQNSFSRTTRFGKSFFTLSDPYFFQVKF